MNQNDIARFWNKVSVKSENECWEWKKISKSHPYGSFWFNGKTERPHRISWMLYNNLPVSQHVLHKCDNPPCVNPLHLFLGTNDDNIKDKIKKGRQPKEENHKSNKLTKEQVIEIFENKNKLSYRELSRIYNVNHSSIGAIFNGKNWSTITGVPKKKRL